jgi:hypothetical protein
MGINPEFGMHDGEPSSSESSSEESSISSASGDDDSDTRYSSS